MGSTIWNAVFLPSLIGQSYIMGYLYIDDALYDLLNDMPMIYTKLTRRMFSVFYGRMCTNRIYLYNIG